jgi:hypothetical protein
MHDDYMLCKVTLGVLKGASKLNALLLLLLLIMWKQDPGLVALCLPDGCRYQVAVRAWTPWTSGDNLGNTG